MGQFAQIDYLAANSSGLGEMAKMVDAQGMLNPSRMRPFIGNDGKTYISVYNNKGDMKDPKSYVNIQVNNTGVLRRDEWIALDAVVQRVAEKRLKAVADLKARGLQTVVGGGMAATVYEHHTQSRAQTATQSMDGITRSQGDRTEYGSNFLPLPITHCDFEIGQRVLESSRRMGTGLDTAGVADATRAVAETLEKSLVQNQSYTFGGGTLYSYLNQPNRVIQTLSTTWTNSGKSPEQIVNEVLTMRQNLMNKNQYGPYVLYIPRNYSIVMQKDYEKTNSSNKTIRQRLLDIEDLDAVIELDYLPDDTVVMISLASDTAIRWLNSMEIQVVQWQSEGGMINHFKVMAIQVPLLRADFDEQIGICVLSA